MYCVDSHSLLLDVGVAKTDSLELVKWVSTGLFDYSAPQIFAEAFSEMLVQRMVLAEPRFCRTPVCLNPLRVSAIGSCIYCVSKRNVYWEIPMNRWFLSLWLTRL